MPRPTSPDKEWVELYNNSSSNIDITQWVITELTSSGNINPHNLPSVIIFSHSSCFYEFASSALNDSGDTISLNNSMGTQMDSYTYPSIPAINLDKTFSRIPDGGIWQSGVTNPSKSNTDCSALSSPATPTPIPNPNPSLIPTSSPTPNPSPIFSISGVPSQINSDQPFSIQVNLTLPGSPNTTYYLTGVFKKVGGTRYFGLTKKDSNWIQYGDDYLNKLKIVTDANGSWSSALEVRPDIDDTDYKGSGDYTFKVGRYTSSGSGPTWSNEITVKINDVNNSSADPSTPKPTPKATPSNNPLPAPSKNSTSSSQPKNYDTLVYHNASVAGIETSAQPDATAETKKQNNTNPFIWIGLIFIFAGGGLIGYIYLKRYAKIRNKF